MDSARKSRTSPARWLLRAVLLVVTLVIAVYAACVVAMPFVSGSTSYKITLNAPVAATWKYASDSTNRAEGVVQRRPI